MTDSRLTIQKLEGVHHVQFMDSRILDEGVIKGIYAQLNELIENNPKIKLLIDFENVDYLSSAVLGKLIAINKAVSTATGQFKICGIKPQIMEVFKITKLDKVLDIAQDAKTAIAAF